MAEREQLPVRQARAGDPDAWGRLFKRYQLPLYVYAFELLRNEQSSLDIVQETFCAAVRHIDALREEERFGSWLFGIAHQKCIQAWRRRQREELFLDERVEEADVAVDDNRPDDAIIRQERQQEFLELLGRLPAAQRSTVVLFFIEDFSIDEIARITGVSAGTVKSRLFYAKKALRNLLETP